ncbi:MAG: hypothetical protein HY238_03205 [Acidobacteria bacterium]|nr:hypothetical protein [Acidobacteriota bacterium]
MRDLPHRSLQFTAYLLNLTGSSNLALHMPTRRRIMTTGRSKRGLVLLGTAVALFISGVAISITATHPFPPTMLDRALQRQRDLPPDAVQALQDLRLVAAVEIAYFSLKGRYASTDELKSAGYLDPLWPRSNPKSYRVSCGPVGDLTGFLCFADRLSPRLPFFRIDATQVVRHRRNERPDGNSPVFQ